MLSFGGGIDSTLAQGSYREWRYGLIAEFLGG